MAIPTPARIHVGTKIHPVDGPKVRWIAPARDGVGHAYPGQRQQRAACGHSAVDERFAYPVAVRCEPCLIVVGAEQVRLVDVPELTKRAWWGDR